jgi:hypothetical protein
MASHVSSEDTSTLLFRKFFRAEYMTEPSEAALQGYDALMLIIKILASPGKDKAQVADYTGLFSTYHFKTVNGMNENQYIRMIRYENYQLVEVK